MPTEHAPAGLFVARATPTPPHEAPQPISGHRDTRSKSRSPHKKSDRPSGAQGDRPEKNGSANRSSLESAAQDFGDLVGVRMCVGNERVVVEGTEPIAECAGRTMGSAYRADPSLRVDIRGPSRRVPRRDEEWGTCWLAAQGSDPQDTFEVGRPGLNFQRHTIAVVRQRDLKVLGEGGRCATAAPLLPWHESAGVPVT